MRWAFGFFTLCIVLAIVRAALIALTIATVLALIYAFLTRPRETLVLLGALTVSGLATAQPLAFIIAVGIVAVALVGAACIKPLRERSVRPPLPIGRDAGSNG